MIVSSSQLQTNVLPPKLSSFKTYGYLNITPTALTFTNNLNPNVAIKINFWGISAPFYLQLDNALHFDVVAPNMPFKQYLIDARVTSVEVVDSRNYKCIAAAFINWLSILRSINDQTLQFPPKKNKQQQQTNQNGFYLPFFDQQLQLNLDLLKVSEKQGLQKAKLGKTKDGQKVGQIRLQINSKVFAKVNEQRFLIRKDRYTQNKFIAANELEDKYRKPSNYPVSKANIQFNNDQPQHLNVNESFMTNKSLGLTVNGRQFSRKSGVSIYDFGRDRDRKLERVREQDSNKQLQSYVQRSLGQRQNLDLQLMRVRMEMEELVGLTEKEKIVTISIKCFESLNKLQGSKSVPYIDVTCLNTNARFRLYSKDSVNPNKVQFGSSLAFPRDTRLLFIANLKKQQKERAIRGELNLNHLSQPHQLNLVSSEGVLEGILHITKITNDLEKEQKLVKEQSGKNQEEGMKRVEKQQFSQVQNKLSKEKIFAISAQEKPSSTDQTSGMRLPMMKKEKEKNYFLLCLKQKREDLSISYKVMNKSIPPTATNKFVILQQSQVFGQQLTISVHRNGCCLHQTSIARINEQIPILSSNITCQLIKQEYLAGLQVFYQLYSGSLPQINYVAQQLASSPAYQSPKKHEFYNIKQVPKSNKESQGQARLIQREIRDIDEGEVKQRGNAMRKLKTQQLNGQDYRKKEQKQRRITTQGRVSGGQSLTAGELMTHNEQNQLNPSEHEHNDNIYLVDLMTRFLHSLTFPKSDIPPSISLQHFVELCLQQDGILQKNSQFREQKELIQLVISIFQEQPESGVDVSALKQSQQAYSTFKGLYTKEIQQLMSTIKKEEPMAFENIRMHCQLGMINEHILWTRSLPKVTKSYVRQRVSKFYRISHYGPTDAQFLLQDLEAKAKPELRQLDISNLGILIRQSVQKYLSNAQLVASQIVSQTLAQNAIDQIWINIRGLNLLFEQLFHLKISLWVSLMLIQQIKVCYGCDLQGQQGIISVSSITQWITTVQNRSFSYNQKSFNSSKVTSKQNFNAFNEKKKEEIEMDQKSKGNLSYMKNQNNDSEIFDIANLLRKREEELQLHENPHSVPNTGKKSILLDAINQNKSGKIKQKAAPMLHQLSEDEVSRDQPIVQKLNPKPKVVGIKIQQIKFYQEFKDAKRVKIQLGIQPNHLKSSQNPYFYLSHFNQNEGNSFNITIDHSDRPTIWIKAFDRDELKGRSGVVWEQYCDCFDKKSVSKTVVLYSNKGTIVGKIVIVFKEDASKPQNKMNQKEQSKREISILQVKLIKPLQIQSRDKLYVKVSEQAQEHQLSLKETTKLKVKEPIYYRQIQIQNEDRQYGCIIPLQQLFLRRQITATYPLITYLNCTFVGNISLAIRILTMQQYEVCQKQSKQQQRWWPLSQQQEEEQNPYDYQRKKEIREKIEVPLKQTRGEVRSKHVKTQKEQKQEVIKRIDNIYKELKAKFSR